MYNIFSPGTMSVLRTRTRKPDSMEHSISHVAKFLEFAGLSSWRIVVGYVYILYPDRSGGRDVSYSVCLH